MTGTGSCGIPLGAAGSGESGTGARRVQMTNPWVEGAPDATPSENGAPFDQLNPWGAARPTRARTARPDAPMAAAFSNTPRLKISPVAPNAFDIQVIQSSQIVPPKI